MQNNTLYTYINIIHIYIYIDIYEAYKQYVHFPAQIVGILCTKLKTIYCWTFSGRAESGAAHRVMKGGGTR